MSVRGTDINPVITNKVNALDSIRANDSAISRTDGPGLGVNPDVDIFGRRSGLNITSGTVERTYGILERVDGSQRPNTGGGVSPAIPTTSAPVQPGRTESFRPHPLGPYPHYKPMNPSGNYTKYN